MSRSVKILARKRVFDRFLKIDQIEHTHSTFDGGVSPPLTRFVMERGDAVAALVHDVVADEVVLTEQFRIATHHDGAGPGWIVEAAAGGIAAGEDPKRAMRRELLEELGYRVRHLTKIGSFYVSPGGTSERIHLYYAKVTPEMLIEPDASGLDSEHEDIATRRMSVRAFLRSVERGEQVDAKTIIAGQWLSLRRRKERRKG